MRGSQGRDKKLFVWQMGLADEHHMSKTLPADGAQGHWPCPWLLHALKVNTLNFCSFGFFPVRSHGLLTEERTAANAVYLVVPDAVNSGGVRLHC